MADSSEQVGRWRLGDIAEDRLTRRLYRVVGFILDPGVIFAPLDPRTMPESRVEVAGCPNELSGLRRYDRGAE